MVSFQCNINSYIIHILMIKCIIENRLFWHFMQSLSTLLTWMICVKCLQKFFMIAYIIWINEYTVLSTVLFFSSTPNYNLSVFWSDIFTLTTQMTSQPQREDFKGSHLLAEPLLYWMYDAKSVNQRDGVGSIKTLTISKAIYYTIIYFISSWSLLLSRSFIH